MTIIEYKLPSVLIPVALPRTQWYVCLHSHNASHLPLISDHFLMGQIGAGCSIHPHSTFASLHCFPWFLLISILINIILPIQKRWDMLHIPEYDIF